jgi:DNA processing protein
MPADREELAPAQQRAWAVLARTPGLTYEHVCTALTNIGDVTDLIRRGADWERCGFPPAARRFLGSLESNSIGQQVEADLEWLQGAERHLIPLTSELYPPLLANIADAPVALYVRGSVSVLTGAQLAMVGSRKPTAGGRETALELAAHLTRCGLTIVSGLAEGIDGASHEGALIAGGPTVAIFGTGLGHVYPTKHATLAERIAANGALVSEFPPDVQVRRENFPRRNRIISGLSLGTVVVEAAEQSGSLITARLAGEQGRAIFAIPGSIHNPMARGCHKLIREGAKLVETADDILSELQLPLLESVAPFSVNKATQKTNAAQLTAGLTSELKIDKEYGILLDALAFDPVDLGTLARRSGLKPETVASMLLILELRGDVETRPGGRYCRSANKPATTTKQ